MGIFSRFENKMEDTVEGAASRMSKAPISPVQIAKKAEKEMRRETMVGAGKEYAPTLYTVLVNPDDDSRLFGYYPTLAGETETYLKAKAAQEGLVMDGDPLVRFIVDDSLRHGKFYVVAEVVAAPIIGQLRQEELERYGLLGRDARGQQSRVQRDQRADAPYGQQGGHDYADDYDQSYDEYDTGYGSYDDFGDYEVGYDQVYTNFDDPEYDLPSQAYGTPQGQGPGAGTPGRAVGGAAAAGAALGAAGIAAASARGAAPRAQQPAMRPSNTIAYAGDQRRSDGAPDFRKVSARLVDLKTKRPYDLAGATITLGRDAANNIVVNDISASRHHAELKMTPQGLWVLTDLNSMNGTSVNGSQIVSQQLYAGDVITIGTTDYEFMLAR